MITGKSLRVWTLALCLGLASSCSSSSGTPVPTNAIVTALQDLTLDPTGTTLIVTLSEDPGTVLTPANFDTDDVQIATSVTVVGSVVTVVWDERVTPSHQVRVTGVSSIETAFAAVTTSDPNPPTFTVDSGVQTVGLGGDTIGVTFSGAQLIPETVEDPSNWVLRIGATNLNLTGSTFDFDDSTQTLAITLGTGANLHASFTLAALSVRSVADVALGATFVGGTATGDVAAPTLLSVNQNLTEDEFGRVVDFTFDEAMDPIFSTKLPNFSVGFPTFTTSVTQPTEAVLRVTFSATVVPGVNTITLANLVDAHGNDAVSGSVAIGVASPVTNAFAASPELRTVENIGGDQVLVSFDQAISPVDGGDDTHWYLEVDGTPVDLSLQVLAYDFLTKSLTIDLVDDFLNGDSFEFGAAPGDQPRDVDGEFFTATFVGTVGGDSDAPAVTTVRQNRTVDPTGATLDVTFTEDLEETSAENTANYTVGALTVDTATRLSDERVVRLELSGLAVPGDVTLDATSIADIAGNVMGADTRNSLTKDDFVAPVAGLELVDAPEGLDNDTVTVTFDDDMVAAEVMDATNWTIESPVGNALDTSLASVSYNSADDQATLTFDGGDGINFQRTDDFRLVLSGMRDIAGNEVDGTALTGAVVAENNLPDVESVWVETSATNMLHVRFTEPVDHADDYYDLGSNPFGLSFYEVYTSGGVLKGTPVAATLDTDTRGVVLTFPFAVIAASDTLDARGVEDLVGNAMFPADDLAVAAEDALEPALSTGVSVLTAVSGEANDTVTVVFDRDVSAWQLLDPDNYTLTAGPTTIDLSVASFERTAADTVQIELDTASAGDLAYNQNYTLTVDGVSSVQGVSMSASDAEAILVGGDSVGAAFPVGRVRLDAQDANSVIVELDEAIDITDAADTSKIDIAATNPTSATLLGPRTLRATFAAPPSVGQTLQFTNLRDRAGNQGTIDIAIAAAVAAGPLVSTVSGTVEPGTGGDVVRVEFNQPFDTSTAFTPTAYTVTNGSELDLSGAFFSLDSATPAVLIHLPAGVDLDPWTGFSVEVDGVSNHDGIAMSPPAVVGGSVSGDIQPPDKNGSFVNHRENIGRRVVDIRFTEAVDGTLPLDPLSYSVDGGNSVVAVEELGDGVYRLTLDLILDLGETISISGVTDLAGNTAGTLVFTPTF